MGCRNVKLTLVAEYIVQWYFVIVAMNPQVL